MNRGFLLGGVDLCDTCLEQWNGKEQNQERQEHCYSEAQIALAIYRIESGCIVRSLSASSLLLS
jgi:hypothetical protein